MKNLSARVLVAMGIVFFSASGAFARSGGISGYSGNPSTCIACHDGGIKPTVSLIGPTSVVAGSTTEYIFRVAGLANLTAGVDISAVGGSLQNLLATTRLLNGEIVQSNNLAPVNGVVDVSFNVVAPAAGSVKIYAAGLSVDGSGTGGDGTSTAVLDIPVVAAGNLPPVANAGGPYSALVAVAVNLDGSLSKDPDGTIAAYEWDFGDGATSAGAKVSHAYAKEGTYTATLTVTDNLGLKGTAKVGVVIRLQNVAPVANAGGPYTASKRGRVTFDAVGSTDADGTIVSYLWDFGDGSTANRARIGHRYIQPGAYDVVLTVTDDAGATAQARIQVVVP